MELYRLFYECLDTDYKETGRSANYAFRRRGDSLKIFFQHSRGRADWQSNLDFPARAYKRMGKTVWLAHRGFIKVWKELEETVSEAVKDKQIKRITVVGYSHGAALALLCHEYIRFHRPDIGSAVKSFGFGSPRVFWGRQNEEIRQRFKGFTVIRNIDDVVTHLPPAVLGFRHVGKMLEIGTHGKYTPIEAHYSENILKELEIYEKSLSPIGK